MVSLLLWERPLSMCFSALGPCRQWGWAHVRPETWESRAGTGAPGAHTSTHDVALKIYPEFRACEYQHMPTGAPPIHTCIGTHTRTHTGTHTPQTARGELGVVIQEQPHEEMG